VRRETPTGNVSAESIETSRGKRDLPVLDCKTGLGKPTSGPAVSWLRLRTLAQCLQTPPNSGGVLKTTNELARFANSCRFGSGRPDSAPKAHPPLVENRRRPVPIRHTSGASVCRIEDPRSDGSRLRRDVGTGLGKPTSWPAVSWLRLRTLAQCLQTAPNSGGVLKTTNELARFANSCRFGSGRPDSNRRRPAWEAGILPLNYARSKNLLR
jgi:hypothetical protein